MNDLRQRRIDSPIGELTAVVSDAGIVRILFPDQSLHDVGLGDLPDADPEEMTALESQLHEYFAGRRREFDLPLDLRGTAFQRAAWLALTTIPYGETVTYGEQADRIGRPGASRAVGAANGQNPIPIVVPCHRVIGADGSLTGFGGGLEVKRFLLELERAQQVLPGM